jgi:phosphopantothenoylcysteine decarboxylase/phosphopantothenate--cysteine ligase
MKEGGFMNFLLGVTGGIAAYKAADLASVLLNKKPNDEAVKKDPSLYTMGEPSAVQVVMTEAAKRIITPMTMATISKRPVMDDAAEWSGDGHIWHIELAKWTGIFIVAPATANTLQTKSMGQ